MLRCMGWHWQPGTTAIRWVSVGCRQDFRHLPSYRYSRTASHRAGAVRLVYDGLFGGVGKRVPCLKRRVDIRRRLSTALTAASMISLMTDCMLREARSRHCWPRPQRYSAPPLKGRTGSIRSPHWPAFRACLIHRGFDMSSTCDTVCSIVATSACSTSPNVDSRFSTKASVSISSSVISFTTFAVMMFLTLSFVFVLLLRRGAGIHIAIRAQDSPDFNVSALAPSGPAIRKAHIRQRSRFTILHSLF